MLKCYGKKEMQVNHMLNGEERREEIIKVLGTEEKPVSGTDLAKRFEVSRQVIVQDIALLRAKNKNILSTNKGYILILEKEKEGKVRRIIPVYHKDEDILKEFYCILDYGAKILDVVVEHEVYGQIRADLLIQTREDAKRFISQLKGTKSKALNFLTEGIHNHTIEASSEDILDKVEEELDKAGILLR